MTGELTTKQKEAQIIKQREALLDEMAEVTKEAAREGLARLRASNEYLVLTQYDLGVIVDRVYSNEDLNEEQRRIEIRKLSQYWNQPSLGPTTLYDLRNVAVAFDRKFVEDQVGLRMANGNCLTWSHFKELQKLSAKKHGAMLKQVRQHSWSAKALALQLQSTKEAEIKRAGGRKPSLPKTPSAMLQKIFASVQQTDNYLTLVSEPLSGIFMEMPPGEVNAQFVENIDNTLARIEEIETHLKETRNQLRKVRTRANTVLAASELTPTAVAAKKAAPEEDETVPVKPEPKLNGRKHPRRVAVA